MKESKAKALSAIFRIARVEIEEISLAPHKVKILPPADEGFIFETNVGLRIEPENKEIIIGVRAKIFSDREKTNSLGKFEAKTTFIIENFSDFPIKGNSIMIPEIAMINFVSIAISTARGILVPYTINTPLKDAILPVQNPVFIAKQLQTKVTNPTVIETE